MLPNFIVVGAMKAGTTSYAALLRNHPDIYMPETETHFFDVDKRYQRGLADYETSFTEWAGESAVGEKTPTYSYKSDVPERIAQFSPNIKLIWLFREPTARAYSHYRFFISRGSERLSFEQAVKREQQGKTPDFTMNYIDRSIYVKQVERYLQYFKREQMLFLVFEAFMNNPADTMRVSCEFLGVDPAFDFGSEIPRENITAIPRNVQVQWLGRHALRPVSTRLWNVLQQANRKSGKYPPMPPETRQELSEFFAPYNASLAQLTGLDLSLWKTKEKGVPAR